MKFPWNKKEISKQEEKIFTPQEEKIFTSRCSYLIPTWDLRVETKTQYRLATREALFVKFKASCDIKDVCLRQFLARDFGLRSWRTPQQSPGERTVWINHELKQRQFIAIMGIVQLSKNPKVSNIMIRMGTAGATTLGLHEIDELYSILPILKKLETYQADDELFSKFGKLEDIRMAAYFSEPYLFEQHQIIHITVQSPEGNKTGDRLMLSGFVMEPAGMSIA